MKRNRVLVCGGRNHADRDYVFSVLDEMHAETAITMIVHGACCLANDQLSGADRWAEEWAISREVPYLGVPAKWKQHGRSAGPKRNQTMIGMAPDVVVAFAGGRGTANMTKIAHEKGVRVKALS